MPTITETPVATAVNAVSYMMEHRTATEQGALRTIVDLMVDARDALIPMYNAINEANRANAEDASKVADITAKDFNIAMVREATLEKLTWKHSAETIREILWDMDVHDEDRLAAFQLWAVGEQGTDDDGNPRPPKATTWDNYMAWLKKGVALGTKDAKGQLKAFAFTNAGKMTPAAKAIQKANEKAADEARRRQLTSINLVPSDKTLDSVYALLCDAHDTARAVLLVKEELTSTPEGKKVWSAASRKFNNARKGK